MEIRKYAALIWHWKWLVVLGVILFGATAFVINRFQTPIYRAHSRLWIDEAGDDRLRDLAVSQRLAVTYADLMTAGTILQQTIEDLDLAYTPAQLRSLVTVSVAPDTQILELTVLDPDPAQAEAIATTLAGNFTAYIDETQNVRYTEPIQRLEEDKALLADQIEAIDVEITLLERFSPEKQAAIERLQQEIDDLRIQYADVFNEERQRAEIRAQIEEAEETLIELERRTPEEEAQLSRLRTRQRELQLTFTEVFNDLQELRIRASTESNAIIVIEEANAGEDPIRPKTARNTVLAMAVGAMVALGAVFLIDYLDDTLKLPHQIAQETGLPAMGVIPAIEGNHSATKVVTHQQPRTPAAEAYRMLRTNLDFAAVDKSLNTLMVTSAAPEEGKSLTIANLGAALAQAGQRVIIVDADLRKPAQHEIFQRPNNRGLTTALLNDNVPASYQIQQTDMADLHLLTSGPLPPNPAELLNSHRMGSILAELTAEADVVLVDTPPALAVADAAILAHKVEGTILVVKAGATRREATLRVIDSLSRAGSAPLGVVMNHTAAGGNNYYYQYAQSDQKPVWLNRNRLYRWLLGTNSQS